MTHWNGGRVVRARGGSKEADAKTQNPTQEVILNPSEYTNISKEDAAAKVEYLAGLIRGMVEGYGEFRVKITEQTGASDYFFDVGYVDPFGEAHTILIDQARRSSFGETLWRSEVPEDEEFLIFWEVWDEESEESESTTHLVVREGIPVSNITGRGDSPETIANIIRPISDTYWQVVVEDGGFFRNDDIPGCCTMNIASGKITINPGPTGHTYDIVSAISFEATPENSQTILLLDNDAFVGTFNEAVYYLTNNPRSSIGLQEFYVPKEQHDTLRVTTDSAP